MYIIHYITLYRKTCMYVLYVHMNEEIRPMHTPKAGSDFKKKAAVDGI